MGTYRELIKEIEEKMSGRTKGLIMFAVVIVVIVLVILA